MNQILLIDSPQKIVSLIFLLTNAVVIVIRKVMWILYVESYFILLATPFIVVRLQCEVVQSSTKNRNRYI